MAFMLRLHIGAIRRGLEGRRQYAEDSRFRLDVVLQGFLDQKELKQCEEHLLRRICDAYRAASSEMGGKAYEPTAWWKVLRRTSLRHVRSALQMGDINTLQHMYANFFRDACSDGLIAKSVLLSPGLPRALAKIHQWAYLSDALWRLDRWASLTGSTCDIEKLQGPGIGNPYGVVLDGVLVSSGAEHQHYGAHRIAGVLRKNKAVVAEIGGGYGAMAYYLLRDHSRITYWNFDLPESLALAAYYLIRSFPEKRVLLYGESQIKDINLNDYDIVLMPLAELENMPQQFADMVFSAHAMSDLSKKALSSYLGLTRHLTVRYFLYQGMAPAADEIKKLISHEYCDLILKEEKQYHLHGCGRSDDLQCELLYEIAAKQSSDV